MLVANMTLGQRMLFTLDAEIRKRVNGLYAVCFFAGCATALELLSAGIVQA